MLKYCWRWLWRQQIVISISRCGLLFGYLLQEGHDGGVFGGGDGAFLGENLALAVNAGHFLHSPSFFSGHSLVLALLDGLQEPLLEILLLVDHLLHQPLEEVLPLPLPLGSPFHFFVRRGGRRGRIRKEIRR